LLALLITLASQGIGSHAAENVLLYTPYTNITVTPGESLTYPVDVINHSSQIEDVELSVDGLPDKWEAKLTADGLTVQQVAVKPNESQKITLQLDVPLQVNKGAYRFQLTAKGKATLPLTVNVSE
ncbi:NEW3 domain-containing protein, partial [Microbacteriaceae bacterium K1510]|nr:NEW3 domain-containing protein [Microbacteriaceae bacterium K1510]